MENVQQHAQEDILDSLAKTQILDLAHNVLTIVKIAIAPTLATVV
jgi:hypothetical protein